jgi:hypothetical protein
MRERLPDLERDAEVAEAPQESFIDLKLMRASRSCGAA